MSVEITRSPTLRCRQDLKSDRQKIRTLVDKLRQKSLAQMKKSRQYVFQLNREKRIEDDEKALRDLVRQELADLEDDIILQEKIYQELLDEVNEWTAQELEKEENYLIGFEGNETLVCPVCQKLSLSLLAIDDEEVAAKTKNKLTCACGAEFSYLGNLEQLNKSMCTKIGEHEKQCPSNLSFFVEPEIAGHDKHLVSICESCDWMYIF